RFEWRTHDAREDRRDNTLRLSTHRTRLGVAFRGRRWRWRFEHRFRFRSASGDGARTRRHVLRTQLQRRFGRTLALVAEGAVAFQARLERTDRDWQRWNAGLGVAVRY
ncbi:MAG: hypothetical protein AAFV29_25805, partial [Myxococcota bacterium]